jgi:hypothetical protein
MSNMNALKWALIYHWQHYKMAAPGRLVSACLIVHFADELGAADMQN